MKKVLTYLKSNQTRFVGELAEYLKFPSVSAQPKHSKDVKSCANWLANHCRVIGLKTKVVSTAGHPIVVATTFVKRNSKLPHFLVYGHYDVQPPEPLDLWKTPPFQPRIVDGQIYARGASDNKGQHFAHLKAVESYLKTGTPLPCEITFVIEGEEEVGSEQLEPFLERNSSGLACDAVVISDTGMPGKGRPALTYALRGIAALELLVHGPAKDLHSGIYGGSVENPAMALCVLLAKLRDARGRILVPGFYDRVVLLSRLERRQFSRLPFDAASFQKLLGSPKLFGESGFTSNEQRSARPTIEINGLTSGYQGEGSKTIVPAWARAKLTCRLVPDQRPAEIAKLLKQFLRKICPPTVRLVVSQGHGAEPYLVSPESRAARAALHALKSAFGSEPYLIREGGSIPIVNQFKRVLGVESLLLGLALPDDNLHSPNEKFDLDCFFGGMRMGAHLWPELAEAVRPSVNGR